MYGWGGDTSAYRGPGSYKYDSARAAHLDKLATDASALGPRTYAKRASPDALVDTKGKTLETRSENPIIVGVDVTGSMAQWPAEIFDRLPLLYQTLSQYKPDVELSFGAIGDAHSDNYPLQVAPFAKGLDLEKSIKALAAEGGGGGQISESYELFGLFARDHIKTPKATNPFLFIFGDEKFYDTINPAQIREYIGDSVGQPLQSADMWKNLTDRFNLYLLHKPYGHGGETGVDRDVVNHWAKAIGKQRIVELVSPERAVDTLMGIVAKHWGEYADFGANMRSRQSNAVVDSVHHSLRHVPDAGDTSSTLRRSAPSTRSSTLSDLYSKATGGKKHD